MAINVKKLDPRISAMFNGRPPYEQFLAAGICALLGPDGVQDLLDEFAPRDPDWTEMVAGLPLLHWNGKTRAQVEAEAGPETADKVGEALGRRGLTYPEDAADTAAADAEAASAAANRAGAFTPSEPVIRDLMTSETPRGEAAPPPDTLPPADAAEPVDADLAAEQAAMADDGGRALDTPDTAAPPTGTQPPPPPPPPTPTQPPAPRPAAAPGRPVAWQPEPEFNGHPYSALKGKSDAELLAMPNIGRETVKSIRKYEAEKPAAAQPPGMRAPAAPQPARPPVSRPQP